MKHCIKTLGIIALLTSLSYGEDAPKEKKGPDPEKVFKKMDADSNGSVSLEEYKASPMGTRQADKAEAKFKKLDADSNDSLSLEEFKAAPIGGKKGGKKKKNGE